MTNYKLGRFAKLVSRTPATIRRWKAEGTISSKRLPSGHRYNSGKVCRLIVAHKDRLVRFGFDLIRRLCESRGCELIVVNQMSLSPEIVGPSHESLPFD